MEVSGNELAMFDRPPIPIAPLQPTTPEAASAPVNSLPLRKAKHRRAKTGCRTCRQRKIKCDESRPQCSKCLSAGRTCGGYPEPEEEKVTIRNGSRTTHGDRTLIKFKPSEVPVVGNDPERIRLFGVFHRSAIVTIPGHTPMRTWKVLIPQLCLTEPTIANAALAVAGLHEETELKRKPLSELSPGHELSSTQAIALKHYGRALNELQAHLRSPNASPVVVLVACIILTTFESLRGQSQAAIAHIQSGNKIIEGLKPISEGSTAAVLTRCMSMHHDFTEDILPGTGDKSQDSPPANLRAGEMKMVSNSFVKLSTLIGSAEEQHMKPIPVSTITGPTPIHIKECPREFSCLDDARGTLFALMNSARQILYSCMILAQEGKLPGPDDSVPRCISIDTQLKRWSDALDRLLGRDMSERQKDHSVPAESSEIVLMRLWRKFISIRLWASILPSRASLDALTPDFEELLDIVEQCLVLQCEGYAARIGRREKRAPVFIMDMGVLPVLFFTARKCTNYDLRWRAVRLVDRAPAREALWDGETVKKTLTRILKDEERASAELEDGRLQDLQGLSAGDLSSSTSVATPPDPPKPFPPWQEFFYPQPTSERSKANDHARRYQEASFAPDESMNTDERKWYDWLSIPQSQIHSLQDSLYNIQVSGSIPSQWSQMQPPQVSSEIMPDRHSQKL